MQLKLTVSSVQSASLGPDAVAWFRLRGGTIGRARDNDWVLPDPERIISSHHARVFYDEGTYLIEDTSSNGTFLNDVDVPLSPSQPTALNHGDILYIGEYEIRVELADDSSIPARSDPYAPSLEPVSPEFVAKPYSPPHSDWAPDIAPGDNIAPPLTGHDPWAKQRYADGHERADETNWGVVQSDHLAADSVNFRPPNASPELIPVDEPPPASDTLPDDWWKSDDETPDIAPPVSPTTPVSPAPSEAQLDDFALPDHDPGLDATPPVRGPGQIDLETGPQPIPVPPVPPATTAEPQIPAATPRTPVVPNEGAERKPPSPTAPEATSPTVDGKRLIDAYFEGLGIRPGTVSSAEYEVLLRQAGRLVKLLTQATIEVLQARSTLKSEFRLSQTIVRTAENNPLKFSLEAEQALQQFFVEKRPGFMNAEAAFSEALKDVKQHQIAVVAGMRAAFDCLLQEFAPETIEAAKAKSGVRRSKLSFGDKSWDFYQTYYREFKEKAGDDFQGIFGEDFVRAYEEQINRMTSSGVGR